MQLSHFAVLLILLPLVLTQTTPINFGQNVVATCPSGTYTASTFNYTLTIPTWSSIATNFVISVQTSGMLSQKNVVVAGLAAGQATWTIAPDTARTNLLEVWVPSQVAGTQVYVTINCDGVFEGNVSFVAQIPTGLTATSVEGISSGAFTGQLQWWVVPASVVNYFSYIRAELCQAPAASNYVNNLRVVFPGVNVTNTGCPLAGSSTTYDLSSGGSNFLAYASVAAGARWISSGVVYFTMYAWSLDDPIVALNYNVYYMSGAPIQYSGALDGSYAGHATKIEDNLIIGGAKSIGYFPQDVDAMKLYFLDTSLHASNPNNLDSRFFASACYLKSQAQSALVPGTLKNGSNDNQMLMSDVGQVKASGFFKGKGIITSATFALTYGDYVVLPNIQDYTEIYVSPNYVMFGALIGVSVVAGILVIAVGVMGWMMHKRRGYHPV